MTCAQYDRLYLQYPELRAFLTTVLDRWIDMRKVIAQRCRTVFIIMEFLEDRPLRQILDTMLRLRPGFATETRALIRS